MKTMSLTIFAIVLCGADSLSLRGQSSLVQVRKPLPQNTSKKQGENMKTLEDMEATLMRMAKSGNVGTPLKGFADLILPHLDSMEVAINTSHSSDQTTMDSFGTAFSACTTAKTTADSEASTLLSTKTSQSTAHKQCRTAEGMAETNYSSCITSKNSLETAKTTACNAYALVNKVPNTNLVPTPGQGASYRSWLVSVRDWVINELANLDAANASCVSSTQLYEAKNLECEGTDGNGGMKQVHDNLKAACNANQTALESAACSYAVKVEDSCSQYSTCYTNANNSYNAGIANLQGAQNNRINEYELVKRLKCFCNLFAAAAGSDLSSTDIDTCKNATHSTTHLMLTYPTLPPVPGPCVVVAQQPCTASYISAEYGSLPSNAPAAACNICPHATTTTTTPLATTFKTAAVSSKSACAITAMDDLVCWGDLTPLGNTWSAFGTVPSGKFLMVDGTYNCYAGLRTNGSVIIFGSCTSGWFGSSGLPGRYFDGPYTEVTYNGATLCGLKAAGSIDCFGSDRAGMRNPPSTGVFSSVNMGGYWGIAIEQTTGHLKTWGQVVVGHVGGPGLGGMLNAGLYLQAQAAYHHSCAIQSPSTLKCVCSCYPRGCGRGDTYNCGNAHIAPSGTFKDLSISRAHQSPCAVRVDGRIACWGELKQGPPPTEDGFMKVFTGMESACALKEDGTLVCWGQSEVVNGVPS